MTLTLNPNSIEDYRRLLAVKRLPKYRVVGRTVEFPDEYKSLIYGDNYSEFKADTYSPADFLFDYQAAISALAIRKRKFAAFVECGLGKSLIAMEFARHAAKQIAVGKCILIVSPLMVVQQTLDEAAKFYGLTLPIEKVAAKNLSHFLTSGEAKIGITNYDGLTEETPQGRLGGLILDESAMLKSAYGKWGQQCLRLGKGLDWKLCLTGTPAPNDRIEFANHAVFMDAFPTVNSFLARFFVNRGETQNRWELKPHAIGPFYRALSHWSIFLNNPATYGWKDNTKAVPPIVLHIDDVAMTDGQRSLTQDVTGTLFGQNAGGIGSRSTLSQIAKGSYRGESIDTNKPEFIRKLVKSWPKESTLIWCRHNAEQEAMEKVFPDAVSLTGATPHWKREEGINAFKAGERKVMISKPKILGLGLNLQVCTRMIFNGLNDSYEEFHQCVKRANRIGSTMPLNVHVPITSIERPMVETVLHKAKRIDADAVEQERIFKESTSDIFEFGRAK